MSDDAYVVLVFVLICLNVTELILGVHIHRSTNRFKAICEADKERLAEIESILSP